MADDEMSSLASQICSQIATVFSTYNHPSPLDTAVSELTLAAKHHRRIFVHGVGREFLMLKSLCMRLCHLGLSAYVVGDVTTPPISSSDLLIVSAGPGSFSTVEAICRVAKSNGARILLVTAQPESQLCKELATAIAYLAARTMADDRHKHDVTVIADGESTSSRELLPMGSLYEGAMFVLFEMVVYRLGEILEESPKVINSRHTNLE